MSEACIIMHSCTGCYEPGEMNAFETLYPWSKKHQCRIGAGCDECDGIGLVGMFIPSLEECRAMARSGPWSNPRKE